MNPPNTPLVGIDLGTTYSVVSYVDRSGVVSTIPNSDGDVLTPSAVYLDQLQAVVGKDAQGAAILAPDRVATRVKREMGLAQYSRCIDHRMFRPETLSAILLQKLKRDAERRIGPIPRAVVTVPAKFDDAARNATLDAGRIAGFEHIDIVNEPTAAAIACCFEESRQHGTDIADLLRRPMTALVYDLGGGTFDATAVRLSKDSVDSIATEGITALGGVDWDDRIVDFIVGEFQSQHQLFIPESRRILFAGKAEAAKKLLSRLPVAPLECSYEDKMIRATMSRAQLEAGTKDLLDRTCQVTDLVRKNAGRVVAPGSSVFRARSPSWGDYDPAVLRNQNRGEPIWRDFDRIFLVGGSTRMPSVRETLQRVTGHEVDTHLDPDQVISHGAAVYAAILEVQRGGGGTCLDPRVRERLRCLSYRPVNANSLGIKAVSSRDGTSNVVTLIPKNSPLPFAQSKIFRSRRDSQSIRVKVFEGEAADVDGNTQVGECRITDLPAGLPAQSPIQVVLRYNLDGTVGVLALDMTGGGFAHAAIQRETGMTQKEIKREAEFVQTLQIQ